MLFFLTITAGNRSFGYPIICKDINSQFYFFNNTSKLLATTKVISGWPYLAIIVYTCMCMNKGNIFSRVCDFIHRLVGGGGVLYYEEVGLLGRRLLLVLVGMTLVQRRDHAGMTGQEGDCPRAEAHVNPLS